MLHTNTLTADSALQKATENQDDDFCPSAEMTVYSSFLLIPFFLLSFLQETHYTLSSNDPAATLTAFSREPCDLE